MRNSADIYELKWKLQVDINWIKVSSTIGNDNIVIQNEIHLPMDMECKRPHSFSRTSIRQCIVELFSPNSIASWREYLYNMALYGTCFSWPLNKYWTLNTEKTQYPTKLRWYSLDMRTECHTIPYFTCGSVQKVNPNKKIK